MSLLRNRPELQFAIHRAFSSLFLPAQAPFGYWGRQKQGQSYCLQCLETKTCLIYTRREFTTSTSSSTKSPLDFLETDGQPKERPHPNHALANYQITPPPRITAAGRIDQILSAKVGSLDAAQVQFTSDAVLTACRPKHNGNNSSESIALADRLIQRLIQEVNTSAATASPIPEKVWNALILGCASLPVGNLTAGQKFPFEMAHAYLVQMLQLHQMYPKLHHAPTDYHYSTVLYACSNCSVVSPSAVTTAEALIRSLEDGSAQQSSSTVAPTVEMYNNIILAHANRAKTVYGAATAAEDWLMHMSKHAQPDTRSFNRVLKAWSNSPEDQGGSRAADILHLMLELVASDVENTSRIRPDVVSFGTVISALAKRKQPEASQLILEEAVTYFTNDGAAVDLTQCWNFALFSWAQSGFPDAPERVEELVQEGIRVGHRHVLVRPDAATYAACIDAHLSSARPNRVEKAEGHLRKMVEEWRKQAPHHSRNEWSPPTWGIAMPTTKEFDTVIHAWYRCQPEYEGDGTQHIGRRAFGYTATHATNLLLTMLELSEGKFVECAPATGTFNMCIDSWCNTGNACLTAALQQANSPADNILNAEIVADHALAYQRAMKEQAMAAAVKAVELLDMAEARRLTNDFSYSNLILLLCRIDNPDCSFQAAKILERLERDTDQRELPWPSNAQSLYSTVISALGKVGTVDSAERALKVLRGIPNVGKRTIKDKAKIYTGVLTAFSKVTGPRTGVVAAELLQEIIALDKNPKNKVSLNTAVFERVLWALASANDKVSAGYACEVLTMMLDLHSTGKPDVEPSTHCFNACIHALTECHDETYTRFAVELIKAIVEKYEGKYLSQLPSPAAFYRVIKSCRDAGSAEMVQQANDIIRVAERLVKSAGR